MNSHFLGTHILILLIGSVFNESRHNHVDLLHGDMWQHIDPVFPSVQVVCTSGKCNLPFQLLFLEGISDGQEL